MTIEQFKEIFPDFKDFEILFISSISRPLDENNNKYCVEFILKNGDIITIDSRRDIFKNKSESAKGIKKDLSIPFGEYNGLWSGYTVEILQERVEKSKPIKLDRGIRGINCKCKVRVDKDGQIYVY